VAHDFLTKGGLQSLTIIPEPDVYRLITAAAKWNPEAEKFEKWVYEKVLPTIHKTGGYSISELPNFEDPAEAARAWADQYEKRKIAEKKNKELTPKAEYTAKVLLSNSLHSMTVIAKDEGTSAKILNKDLHSVGIQYKTKSGQWVLYAKYQDRGFTGTKTTTFADNNGNTITKTHTYWTEKGRKFIHDLIEEGIIGAYKKDEAKRRKLKNNKITNLKF